MKYFVENFHRKEVVRHRYSLSYQETSKYSMYLNWNCSKIPYWSLLRFWSEWISMILAITRTNCWHWVSLLFYWINENINENNAIQENLPTSLSESWHILFSRPCRWCTVGKFACIGLKEFNWEYDVANIQVLFSLVCP